MNDHFLYHYGTPRHSGRYPYGSGKRPYQRIKSPSTSHTSKDPNKANDIYNSMSKKEKYYLTVEKNQKKYVTDEEYLSEKSKLGYSFIQEYKDVPVSFIDIWLINDETGAVSIGTRNGSDYRGKGYASYAVKKGIEWFNRHPELTSLEWGVHKDNVASQKLAQKFGFNYEPEKDYDVWLTYERHK